MKRFGLTTMLVLASFSFAPALGRADDAKSSGGTTAKVYGEWLIRVHPDKGAPYRKLIEEKGLPLFRAAGGRMVGWWNTLVGNLYEHVTIWEYDNMAAFEKAVQFLGSNKQFAEFVAARDPLLDGEENRFLKLTAFAERPSLPEPAKFVIHEIHRVPLRQSGAYLGFMEKEGLALIKKHGFHPVGPWVVAVGKWTEVTYLFRFESLAEREGLIAKFSAHPDAQTYNGKVNGLVSEVTTRLLLPAPFAPPPRSAAEQSIKSALLPHLEQMAPGVVAAGFSDQYASMNCGWVALGAQTLLIDLPRGLKAPEFVAEVAKLSGKPIRTLVLTHLEKGDGPIVASLLQQGIANVVTSDGLRTELLAASSQIAPAQVRACATPTSVGDATVPVDVLPLDRIVGKGGAAVHLPKHQVLFAGPFVVNGPRAKLPNSDTGLWVETLRRLEKLGATQVVPGFGSWGKARMLARQRRYLAELRRQVSYLIAQGRPHAAIQNEVRVPDDYFVWTPYGYPAPEDVEHVYRELTVPAAPFNGRVPGKSDSRPHALVLIGDLYHEPGHLEEGLRPVFEATGVIPHFTVDVNALSAENLAKVQLLVILRDGLQHPKTGEKSEFIWMTPEQERAVVAYVEGGGAFLNLHNSMGLYPDNGPYLKLVGGRYIGHGPLERFRVEVVDRDHPVTRGVQEFSVADEQHTPPYDAGKVHLLLRNRSDSGKFAAAGWVYEPGRGRLCHLANGHTRDALLQPMYQLLMRNAVTWCLRRNDTGSPAPATGR